MIEFKQVGFRYEASTSDSLAHVSFRVRRGELVVLAGRSGCGKTTIARLVEGLIPQFYPGRITGDVLIDGRSTLHMEAQERAGLVGAVYQDPRSQFFMADTTRELAFGCENMGLKRGEIIERVAGAVQLLGLEALLNRSIHALSSGQKQRIAIGSVCAFAPCAYVLDEPSANLDPAARRQLARALRNIKQEGGTVLIAEHSLDYLRDLLDRVLYLDGGRLARVFSREQFASMQKGEREALGLRDLYPERCAILRRSGRPALRTAPPAPARRDGETPPEPALRVCDLGVSYERDLPILQKLSFQAEEGEAIGIVGANGAGKTTLIAALAGLVRKTSGSVRYKGRLLDTKGRRSLFYLVAQDSDYQLFGSSVEEDLRLGDAQASPQAIDEVLADLGLLEVKDRHPLSLSGGQKQRVTLAGALVKRSPVICLDEPTSGLDLESMGKVADLMQDLAAKGAIVLLVSHDAEFMARSCSRVIRIDEGRVVDDYAVEGAARRDSRENTSQNSIVGEA